ncbi:MAG TPA: hypothetical protein PLB41_19590 [Rubrivivax sp.]|mgnify:FL=1|nr:hypothetical protein [Rubrivivax sp.]HPO18500.1 hypothetical protein [Rubrivivax sp.]
MHAAAQITPAKALGLLVVIAAVVTGFVALTAAVGNHEAWAGFLFLLYWSMVEGMKTEALPKSILGALAGLGIASLLFLLPDRLGSTPGLLAFLVVILVLVYLQLRSRLPMAINPATMIYLTVATIPHVQAHASFTQTLGALLLGVAYFGGLAVIVTWVMKRRAAASPETP